MFAVKGKEDVTIHVRDRGGGIPRRLMGPIFEYLYTTANPVVTSSHEVHVRNQFKEILVRRPHSAVDSVLASRQAALGSIFGVLDFFLNLMLPNLSRTHCLESGQCKA